MPRKKQAAEPGFNVFQCQLCADKPQFDVAGNFSAHLREVHQMDTKAQYQKLMSRHLDAAEWYQTDYEWKDGDVTFALQSVRQPRTGEDAALWRSE